MNKMIVLVVALLSLSAFAQDNPKHQVMFGNTFSVGWSGSGSTAEVDSDLGIKDYDIANGELSLNYAYTIAPQFQLGAHFSNEMDSSETKYAAGGKVESEETSTSLVVFGIFNFSEDLFNSFYLGAGIGKSWSDSTDKDSTGGTTVENDLEYDANIYYLTFGKRFNLESLGIKNLTFSPGISYFHMDINGDAEDAGLESISTVVIDLVKFDLLF